MRRENLNFIENQSGKNTPPEMINVLHAVEHDPKINVRANMHTFRELYKQKGVNLEDWYLSHKVSSSREEIQDDFVNGKNIGVIANLTETLPLYANAPGRLGEYIDALVTKTARQDDQGNSFIDFIIEVKNKWLEKDAPKELQDTPAKMSFLIDMTVAEENQLHHKEHSLRKEHLDKGEKASVKCYQNSFGDLGIERPKIIVAKTKDYIGKVSETLGGYITKLASDKFSINNPKKFDEEYRAYFLDLMSAIGENASANIAYMNNLPPDSKRQALVREYQKIVAFVNAYKKTPVMHKREA